MARPKKYSGPSDSFSQHVGWSMRSLCQHARMYTLNLAKCYPTGRENCAANQMVGWRFLLAVIFKIGSLNTSITEHVTIFFVCREVICNYADIVFANGDEARAICNLSSKDDLVSAARYLSHFVPLVSVTDGPKGSYIGMKGEAIYVPPSPCVPVDTCGAGDAYASGILYGILRGHSDLKSMGLLASRVAAVVVGQQGTRLRVHDAGRLVESFAFHLESSSISSDHISSSWYKFKTIYF